MTTISKYVSYKEATVSQTAVRKGIDNTPDEATLERMRYVASNTFDKIREHFGKPLIVSSFYRSAKLNKAVGGSATSQHLTGEAIDIEGTGDVTNAEIFEWAKANLEFDQLIWEFGTKKEPSWVHISLKAKGKNRKQILYIGV